jgi:hypothetical protein
MQAPHQNASPLGQSYPPACEAKARHTRSLSTKMASSTVDSCRPKSGTHTMEWTEKCCGCPSDYYKRKKITRSVDVICDINICDPTGIIVKVSVKRYPEHVSNSLFSAFLVIGRSCVAWGCAWVTVKLSLILGDGEQLRRHLRGVVLLYDGPKWHLSGHEHSKYCTNTSF